MALLKKVGKMQEDGLQETEISQRLMEEGASPREIDDALDQSRVKSAVGTYEDLSAPQIPPPNMTQQFGESTSPYPTFEPKIAEHAVDNDVPMEEPTIAPPVSQETGQDYEMPQEQFPQEQMEYPEYQQDYPEYQYQYAQPMDTDMINEIAGQIIDEKTQEMNKQITALTKFKI